MNPISTIRNAVKPPGWAGAFTRKWLQFFGYNYRYLAGDHFAGTWIELIDLITVFPLLGPYPFTRSILRQPPDFAVGNG